MNDSKPDFRTRAVHSGHGADPHTGAHATPIYQTSTFSYGSFDRGARLFAGEENGYIYSRIGNPTVRALELKLADLESAEDALCFSSGMAAVAALAFTVLNPGDEVLFIGPLYGGTEGFFLETLSRMGMVITEAHDETDLESRVSARTKLVYVESPMNPNLRLVDLARVARAAKSVEALSVTDNTFSTPYLTRPIELGFDMVVHSMTKYLGGHGDAIGGALVGSAELCYRVRLEGLRHLGGSLGPQEAYLFLRGIKTLPLRMEAHCDGAERVAAWLRERQLEGNSGIAHLHYPGLPSHPQADLAARQMTRPGGMIALELEGGLSAARAFLDGLELFTQAVSLGDVESLASHPASTTHQLIPLETRGRQGVTDGLVRLSIGVEHPDDLIADLETGLKAVQAAQVVGTLTD
jgi:methionine-gamma-lyase